MKLFLSTVAIAILMIAVASCGSKSSHDRDLPFTLNPSSKSFAEAPVAAELKIVGEDTIVVGRIRSTPETVTLLASDLLDELEIVKLESTDEALVGTGLTWVSDKRLIIYDGKEIKQFDRKGKYLGTISSKGQGPGEYSAPYNLVIDEGGSSIYMIEYNATDVKIYNMEGKYVGKIPLAEKVKKGFFTIDNDRRTITVASLPFEGISAHGPVWTQDFEGNILSEVHRPDIAVKPDFSNEVYRGGTSGNGEFSYSQFRIIPSADTLYRYADGRFRPDFTFDFGDEVPMHVLHSHPQFYSLVTFGDPVQKSESSYQLPHRTPFVIDRATLRGAPAVLMFDNIGTLTMDRGWTDGVSSEYLVWGIEAGDLLDYLNAAPESHPLANEEGIKRMQELRNSIDPEDNNYIIIGKWKK